MSKYAEIYLRATFSPTTERETRSLRQIIKTEDDVVTLEDEYAESGESYYSARSGRKLNKDGSPHPWDMWRMKIR